MAVQLDLFDLEHNRRDAIVFELQKLSDDIHKMRRSFFVRLDAQEKKYQKILQELDKTK